MRHIPRLTTPTPEPGGHLDEETKQVLDDIRDVLADAISQKDVRSEAKVVDSTRDRSCD